MIITSLKTGLAAAAIIAMTIPGISYAAMFAYVDQSGDVKTVVADTPSQALMTAPGIGVHSGVLLLDSADDNAVVGDSVSGA